MKRFLLCLLVSSSILSVEKDEQEKNLSVSECFVGQVLKCAGGEEFNLSWPYLTEKTIKGTWGSSNSLYDITARLDLVEDIDSEECEGRVDIRAAFVMPKGQESELKPLVKDMKSGTSSFVDDQFTRCKIIPSDGGSTWYACASRMPLALFKQLLDDSVAKK